MVWSNNYQIAEYSEFFYNKMLWDDPPSRLWRFGEAGSFELAA